MNNEKLTHRLDSLISHNLLPFVYARIESASGDVLFEHGAVNKNIYPDLEISKDTWFRVWSMSKIVTISIAMDLVEDGMLHLEDPVTKYIPEFKNLQVALTNDGRSILDLEYGSTQGVCPLQYIPVAHEMTVEHLIHHKGGFYYPWTSFSCLDSTWMALDWKSITNSQDLIDQLAQATFGSTTRNKILLWIEYNYTRIGS